MIPELISTCNVCSRSETLNPSKAPLFQIIVKADGFTLEATENFIVEITMTCNECLKDVLDN